MKIENDSYHCVPHHPVGQMLETYINTPKIQTLSQEKTASTAS